MPVLCIGPICIPLNLLLPFLLGVAHQYGWLKWFRREWVTLQHWRQKIAGRSTAAASTSTSQACPAAGSTASATQQRYLCEGGVCRLVPDEPQPTDLAAADQLGSSKAGSRAQEAAAAVRQRHGGASVQGSKAVEL